MFEQRGGQFLDLAGQQRRPPDDLAECGQCAVDRLDQLEGVEPLKLDEGVDGTLAAAAVTRRLGLGLDDVVTL